MRHRSSRHRPVTQPGTENRLTAIQGERRMTGGPGSDYHYTRDHLGSIREVLETDGDVYLRYDYTPWGERLKLGGTATTAESDAFEWGFTGHHYHARSGLHLALYRAYDANLGRWLSEDPLGEAGGLNLYGYVGNAPMSAWDPLGLFEVFGHTPSEWRQAVSDSWHDGEIQDAALGGFAAWADGALPFADPFADAGAYDPCDSEFAFGQNVGALNRDAAAFLGAGAIGGGILRASGVATPAIGESMAVGRYAISQLFSEASIGLLGNAGASAFTNTLAAYGLYDSYSNIRDLLDNFNDSFNCP